MIGIELVESKETRLPLADKAPKLHAELPRYARRKHGVLLSMRSSAITLTPPLVISESEVTKVCDALADTINHIDPSEFSFPD